MPAFTKEIVVTAPGKATAEFTYMIEEALLESGLNEGTVTVFCCHTSCSLVIMENADPSARRDLERFIDRLVPEDDPDFTHTYEGPDDMPSHIKMALTPHGRGHPLRQKPPLPRHLAGRLPLGAPRPQP